MANDSLAGLLRMRADTIFGAKEDLAVLRDGRARLYGG